MKIKTIIIFWLSFLLGQEISVSINEDIFLIERVEKVESFIDSLLIKKGHFGMEAHLEDLHYQSMPNVHYSTHEKNKTVDSLFFVEKININQTVLKKIFKPLLKASTMFDIHRKYTYLNSGYGFLSSQYSLHPGNLYGDKLGILLDFKPEFKSYFSGIAGAGRTDSEEWAITGEVNIHLENSWRTANISDIEWKRQNEESQTLLLAHEEPFPLGLPFGTSFSYIQNFRDGHYFHHKSEVNFVWVMNSGKWSFGGGGEILTPTEKGDSLGIQAFKSQTINVYYYGDKRNNYWLPSDGYFWKMKMRGGEMTSNENTLLTANIQTEFEYYRPITKRVFIKSTLWADGVWNQNAVVHLGQNIRYGGIDNLRGYDEEFFRGTHVFIPSLNLGVVISQNIQILLFTESAVQKEIQPIPYSYGVGLKQKNRNSFMEIYFGIPREETFSRGKIHVKFFSLID